MRQISLSHADLYRGDLILVNAAHACCPGEPLPLSPAHEGSPVLLARRAATLLGALMAEIQGWEGIVPVSGWRSQNEQKRIYFDSLRENGEAFTRAFVARPGHSEHQTGLAIGGELSPCGFINDDSNAVGSVHLGACFTLPVEGEVSVKETEKLEGLWMTKAELKDNYDSMETWTQIALEVL